MKNYIYESLLISKNAYNLLRQFDKRTTAFNFDDEEDCIDFFATFINFCDNRLDSWEENINNYIEDQVDNDFRKRKLQKFVNSNLNNPSGIIIELFKGKEINLGSISILFAYFPEDVIYEFLAEQH